jgi:hypothetical protein
MRSFIAMPRCGTKERVRFWLQTLGLFLCLIAGFEVLSRLFIGHSPAIRFDPRYDRLPKANQPVVQSSEGFSRARTNELGHLDARMPGRPPSNGILILGDSYTEARQVAMSERFSDRLEQLLGRRVYNVGHTGWSPVHSLEFLRSEQAAFTPATVIVQVSGNDLEDLFATKRPHLVESVPNGFSIVLPRRNKRGLAKQVTAVREAVSARSAFAGEAIVALLTLFKSGDGGDDGGDAHQCAAPSPRFTAAVRWLMIEFQRTHPDVRWLYLPLLDYQAGCTDKCAAAAAMFHQAAAANRVPLVDATAAMCSQFAASHQPLHGFWNTIPGTGHMNAAGHEVVAIELAKSFQHRAVP